MAFLPNTPTVTLTARLTPYGREQLLANTNSIISHFSLGDSDANYRTFEGLGLGDVPSSSGMIGSESTTNNSVANNVQIKNKVIVDNSGVNIKEVEKNSNSINSSLKKLGLINIEKSDVRSFIIDRNNYLTDTNTNLFQSFGLPITESSKKIFTSVNSNNNGYADTALNGINQDKVLVISIDGSKYGEMIDGRAFKTTITTSAGTYTLYSAYQRNLTALSAQDANTIETSNKSKIMGENIVFLFSDEIKRPNNNFSLSWATGYNTVKPYSVNKKELFNMTTNTSLNNFADRAVGMVCLDKGFVIITEPVIVNSYVRGDEINIEFDSLVTEVSQDVTCIVNRGEFGRSVNPTYNPGDAIRVSEIGLHDSTGKLMAIAKTNKHILVGINQFLALGIKITV